MTWDETLDAMVRDGAIRLWRASRGWAVVYRLGREGWEGCSLIRRPGGEWMATESLAGGTRRGSRWQPVAVVHHRAIPVDRRGATRNRGYFLDITRRCETCKRVLPLAQFERQRRDTTAFRSWECNDCSAERVQELGKYRTGRRIGDYLRRDSHASKPPVKSEL
jgi:hypothetical protein